MADHDHASEAERARDNGAPRRTAAPAKEAGATSAGATSAGATSAGAGTAPARAVAPDAARPPAAASLGARQVKAKMVTGPASDPAEREADRAAGQVLRMAAPEQNRPPAVDPTVADASSRGPGRATSNPPEPQHPAAGTVSGPAGTAPGPAAATAPGPVRRQAVADHDPLGGKEVPEETQRYLDRSQGTGSPLPDGTRRYFEDRFSADFGGVRVHDDDEADRAARSIGALAFTRGSDIWFSAGTYDPVTDDGRRLLAHELAHIAQQHPGIGRQADERAGAAAAPAADQAQAASGPVIRRAPASSKDKKDASKDKPVPKGTIDTTKLTLEIDELPVPAWKAVPPYSTPPLQWRKPAEGRPGDQRSIWLSDPGLRGQATEGVKEHITELKLGSPPYFLQGHATKGKSGFVFVGSAADIGAAIVIPPWDKDLGFHRFDVDHMKEWQLGGDNLIGNMWLLDPSLNRSSGSTINNNIRNQVDAFLADPALVNPPSLEDVHTKYTVTFGRPTPQTAQAPKQSDSWSRDDIGKPAHVAGLERVPDHALADVKGTPERLVIYQRAGGGQVRRLPLHGRTGNVSDWKGRGYQITSVTWGLDGASPGSGVVGKITGTVIKDSKVINDAELQVDILGMTGVDYGGFVDRGAISRMRRGIIDAKFASPVEFPDLEFDLEKGLIGRGVIPTPSISLLRNVQIAVVLDGGEVGAEAEIAAPDLKLPGPFKVNGGALTLTGTASGLSVTGRVDFEIEGLAKGHVLGTKSAAPGFSLEGALDFDTKMFTEAHLGLSYRDGHFGVQGRLAVGEGKIAGVRSAQATVSVEDEKVAATGTFTPSLRGFEHGELGFKYDPATGAEITGSLQLSAGLPGLRGGTLQGRIAQRPGGQGYSLAGDITLQPSIPGVTSDIHGHYEDGAFGVEADVGYKRGMLDGSVHIGVTNQAPGADGRPAGPPTDHLTTFGGGEVTITIAPWLRGRIGLKLQPNGEMIVTGEVGLPDHLDVFPEQRLDKNIFTIGLDIPIVGVAVLGQRIGIFATIRGGLDASAGIGPGQLRSLALRVTYNPDREADTRIEGSAAFHVPAQAGLRLFVQGGLGAGIPVVSATAGLEVSGALGLEGAADASVNVAWTPARGLVLDARGEIYVEPKFRFEISGFVDVSADLWIDTIELYHKRWQLAAFEYGSNLRFGVAFPIHYEEGKPFQLSLDQVQFTYPAIDAKEILSGLIDRIA